MSLNGLDAAAVISAHQNALTDAGGWFLLKYVNRDTVELLKRGTGGVVETKNAVEQYEEKSPLYGLVQYRRKRIVLKYVPEGTSRLLQVLDAFPHDTVFSFTAPSELVDSALGLSTMLQPSAHSGNLTPSTTSGRQNRLNEIREDGEDATPSPSIVQPRIVIPPARTRQESPAPAPSRSDLDGLPASALKAKALLAKRKEADLAAVDQGRSPASSSVTARPKTPSSSERTATVIATAIAAAAEAAVREEPSLKYLREPETPRPLTAPTSTVPEPRYDVSFAKSPKPESRNTHETTSKSRDEPVPTTPAKLDLQSFAEKPSGRSSHTRHLSEHETNSITQWNEQVAAYTVPAPKTKKKLAPRPHIDPFSSARSRTSNTVAALPQSVRASTRSNFGSPSRPESRQSSKSVPTRFIPVQSQVPPLPTNLYHPPLYQQLDVRKPPSIASSAVTDFSSATPEKLRLMKALQLRKRNQLLSSRAASVQSSRTQISYGGEHHGRNVSEISEARSVIPVSTPTPTPTPINRVARVSAEHKSDINSITASPTSATTASIDQSTKPSSYTDAISGKISPRSFSGDTNSSATPRAGIGRRQPLAVKPPSQNSDAASEDEEDAKKLNIPDRSPVEEAFDRLTGATTPPIPETVLHQPTPKSDVKLIYKSAVVQPLALTTENLDVSNRDLSTKKSFNSDASSGNKHKSRRRRGIGSMQITNSIEGTENSDEEAFMEELRNATVQEAKPISVARTPTPARMRKLSTDKLRDITRVQTTDSYRSIKSNPGEAEKSHTGNNSMTLPQWQQPTNNDGSPVVPLSKKPTLSSGISKRIKALEVLTYRENVQNTSPPSPRETSASRTSFTNLMNRASFISQHHAPNTSTDKSPPKRLSESKPVQAIVSKEDNIPRPLVQRQGELAEVFSPQRKGETISVTARIVRDRHAPPATQFYHDPSVNLHRSPLIVEHERRESESSKPVMPRENSGISIDVPPLSPSSDRRRFSFSSHKSGPIPKQSYGESRSNRVAGNTKENKYATSNTETASITEEKRASRANRFIKRMSGLSSRLGHISTKKSPNKDRSAPDTIMEQSESLQRRGSVADSLLQVIDIGDVNVQFPETLLWKRRFLRIDDQGYLIFSPPTDNAHVRMAARKFHLGDLKTPSLPDREREEMAWSICLDMKDGTCVQCACESKRAQREVLKMLLDAHDAYKSLYD